MQKTTLCLLMRDDEILLAMKKRGFGVGKLNGVGGKVKEGESVKLAAIREMEEEIGVKSAGGHLEDVGSLKFYFHDKPEWDQHMHIFIVRNWEGVPQESEEMNPGWYKHDSIPFHSMWAGDKHWLPIVLAGNRVEGEFRFSSDGGDILQFDIRKQ